MTKISKDLEKETRKIKLQIVTKMNQISELYQELSDVYYYEYDELCKLSDNDKLDYDLEQQLKEDKRYLRQHMWIARADSDIFKNKAEYIENREYRDEENN